MKLYFNGCSHTWGDDLVEPQASCWPTLIGQQTGYNYVNDSVSGGTNERILYQTIKNIDFYDKFYIAWTYTTRFTRYRSENNFEVNFNPQLKHSLYSNDAAFKDYGKIHYQTWHNELFNFKLWLQQIILLQALFKVKNKKFVMLNADNNYINKWTVDWSLFNQNVKSLLCFDLMNDDQLYCEHQEIQALVRQIDFSNFVNWQTWWITCLTAQYPTGNTGHLLEQGHRVVAEYILNYESCA